MAMKNVNGIQVEETAEDIAAKESKKAAYEVERADYIANHKYKDDRRKAYGSLGDQQDMQYWDSVNDTTVWADHIATVKSDYPKPD